MSKRSDIIEGTLAAQARGGLIYTEVLGWIDLGHARGDDIRTLMKKIDAGESMNEEYYDVTYAQSMVSPKFMQTIQPYNDWKSGNVAIATLDGSFIQDGKRKDLIV
ncbi:MULTISPECIES: hypothetical protein [Enterobacteriaceae]|uniref:hypothetical protein n=1 Tax=Enterobacteriaceae TaxID=543 RepID=UPI001643C895|nr:hypothetical protein [Pseudescherichia sp.]